MNSIFAVCRKISALVQTPWSIYVSLGGGGARSEVAIYSPCLPSLDWKRKQQSLGEMWWFPVSSLGTQAPPAESESWGWGVRGASPLGVWAPGREGRQSPGWEESCLPV